MRLKVGGKIARNSHPKLILATKLIYVHPQAAKKAIRNEAVAAILSAMNI